jgi:hypothetical protein
MYNRICTIANLLMLMLFNGPSMMNHVSNEKKLQYFLTKFS